MNLVKAEITKMRSVRSTIWSLVAMIASSVGLATVVALVYRSEWAALPEEERSFVLQDTVGLLLEPATFLGQIAVCVLAVMIITAEYGSGTISATMLGAPKRLPVMFAKIAILLSLVFVVAEVLAFASFHAGEAILSEYVSVSIGDPGVLGVLLAFGLWMTLVAALSFGLATIIRHTAGAVTAAIGVVLVLPILSTLLPGETGEKISALLPASGNAQMMLSNDSITGYPYSAEVAMTAFALWALLAMTFGLRLMVRRDV